MRGVQWAVMYPARKADGPGSALARLLPHSARPGRTPQVSQHVSSRAGATTSGGSASPGALCRPPSAPCAHPVSARPEGLAGSEGTEHGTGEGLICRAPSPPGAGSCWKHSAPSWVPDAQHPAASCTPHAWIKTHLGLEEGLVASLFPFPVPFPKPGSAPSRSIPVAGAAGQLDPPGSSIPSPGADRVPSPLCLQPPPDTSP